MRYPYSEKMALAHQSDGGLAITDVAGMGPLSFRQNVTCGHIPRGVAVEWTDLRRDRLIGGVMSRAEALRLRDWLKTVLDGQEQR